MPDLLARQRVRLTRTLFASVALGTTSLYAAFTAAPLLVGIVMSSHFLGMYAFAPAIGKLVGRLGAATCAIAGLVILIAAAAGASLGSGDSSAWMSTSLFFLGLGWCFSFVAGSALLTRGLAYKERVLLQGQVDGVVWLSSATASVVSGILLQAFGFAALSLVGAALVIGPLMLVAARRATIEPAAA